MKDITHDTGEHLEKQTQHHPERTRERPTIMPYVDIYENDQEILLMADLPGVSRDQLMIHLDRDQLTIEGVRSEEQPGQPLATEYRPSDYRRTFLVPAGLDPAKVSADLKQGVLWLHLPKSDAMKRRRIEVRSGD